MRSSNYSYCDLYFPFSEAARVLNVTPYDLTLAANIGLLNVEVNREDIYGPIIHMGAIFSFVFRSGFLSQNIDFPDIEDFLDSMEELGCNNIVDMDESSSFVNCICKTLDLGPKAFAIVLREFLPEVDNFLAEKVHSNISIRIQSLFDSIHVTHDQDSFLGHPAGIVARMPQGIHLANRVC